MKGHVRKRGNRWYIVVDLPRGADGKRRQKWLSAGRTKKEAEAVCSSMVDELHKQTYVEPTDLTVSEYLEKWLGACKPRVTAKTFEGYKAIVENNVSPRLGYGRLSKLSPLDIQDFYAWELEAGRQNGKGGLSAQTVLHHHRVIKRALAQAVKWRMLPNNPADAVEPPRPERVEMKTLDRNRVDALLKALEEHRLRVPTLVAVTTGLRRGELLGLKWSDINLAKATLTVRRSLEQTREGLRFKDPKTKKSRRTIALAPMTVAALKAHKAAQARTRLATGAAYQDSGLVFCDELGAAWKPNSLSSSFISKAKRAGFSIRFHDLRHSHATLLLEQGVNPKVVSERLGHSSVSITLDCYSHVLPNMQETAAQATEIALKG